MAVSEFPWQKGGDLRTGFAVLCGGCYLLNRVMIFLSCRRINKVLLSRTRKEFPTKRSRISSHQTRLDPRGCCALHLQNATEKAPETTNCIQPYGPLPRKLTRFFRRKRQSRPQLGESSSVSTEHPPPTLHAVFLLR